MNKTFTTKNWEELDLDQLLDLFESENYYLDELTVRKLLIYLKLGKPIGLRGEPGVGKSELPEILARILSAKFVDIECHSQLESSDIGASWNAFKQIVDAQSGKLLDEPFSAKYLNHTPFIECLRSEEMVILRVDEVDKLNETTSNFFLRFLDKKELVIHDLASDSKVMKAKAPIFVFLTSNDYNELDPAIMRRIAWIELKFPDEKILTNIIKAKTNVDLAVARRISYIVHKLRKLDLKKKPSIGEAIEWTKGLMIEANGKISLDTLQVTLGLLLKYPEDEVKGWKEIESWVDF
ncbi:MAG: AAA family ATPase [Heyndrickxia sp.]